MASAALARFAVGISEAQVLLAATSFVRLKPQARANVQVLAHAALASLVSSWEAYIENLVGTFHSAIAKQVPARILQLHALGRALSESRVKLFHTPNAENTRDLLVSCTGYDPLPDWVWLRARMNGLDVRTRLNEIVKVRHAFAHGFPVPALSWTTSPRGSVRLTPTGVRRCASLISHLASRTDRGMHRHLKRTYGIGVPW